MSIGEQKRGPGQTLVLTLTSPRDLLCTFPPCLNMQRRCQFDTDDDIQNDHRYLKSIGGAPLGKVFARLLQLLVHGAVLQTQLLSSMQAVLLLVMPTTLGYWEPRSLIPL